MPYINVNDAYILDNTGKQVDDAVDYALYNSNRNLLDNPWFTVNQRGITSLTVGTGKTYTLDRWYAFRANITALSGGGITFAWNGTDLTSGLLTQGSAYDLRGKTLTMSAIINGALRSWTANFTGAAISYTFSDIGIRFQLNQAGSNTYAQIFIMTATPVTISAVKLELGSYSTLANDVPPDYGEELRKCMYYCRVLDGTNSYVAIGQAVASTAIRVDFPWVMRARPSIATSGTIQLYGTGGPLTASTPTVTGWTNASVDVNFPVTGATTWESYLLSIANGGKIVLSADL